MLNRKLVSNNAGGIDPAYAACMATISTPIDTTITVPVGQVHCSSGAIVVDSVAAGNGIVVINGVWRLT